MKKQLLKLFLLLLFGNIFAQSTYNSSNYATVGDSFYLTNASNLATDFFTTGANYNWDFSALTGISQDFLQFRNPTATGFSLFTFPYIFNSNNTNLSSTDGTTSTLNVAGQTIGITDTNDYYKKNSTNLKQVATSYKLNYNGTLIPITAQYTAPDVVYTFPITYGNTETNIGAVTTNIPTVLYENKTIQRTNLVDGWGSITTPFGTFSNTLRMTTTLVQNDTISVLGTGLPRIIRTTRELKWLETSKKYPVLIVTQNNTAGNWVTTKVQFMANQQDFQTVAFFAYSPIAPTAGATVSFQNLSTNGNTYSWNFNDLSSGTANTSSSENPNHVFMTDGTYQVTLTVSNGTFTNSITIPVVVGSVLNSYQITDSKKVLVVPNPFKNYITITSQDANSEYELVDLQGKILYNGTAIEKVDFSYLSKGIYIIKVKSENGVTDFKIVKD